MKLYPEKLAESFASSLPLLYIISSDETLLVNEAADSIRKAAKQQGFLEREIFHAESSNFDWEEVLQSLNSMSLFSEKKLLELRCTKKTLNDEKFLRYWDRPNPDVVVLILTEKLDKTTQKTKWFGSLEKVSQFIEIWPMDDGQLNRWLTQRAKRQGLNIDQQGIRILQDRTEGNLLASAQELEKLHLLFGNETITPEKLIDAISNNARYDIFKLTDAALTGNKNDTLKILRGLRDEGTADTLILWSLTKELHLLANASEAISQGQQASDALLRQGVWQKRLPLFQQALKRLNSKKIYQLLQAAHHIDLSIKGMGTKNAGDMLESLCLSLAGASNDPLS